MERNDRIFSFVWFALGLGQCVEACRLGLGKVSEPDTGFAPFIGGVLIILFSAFLFAESSMAIRKNPAIKLSIWADVNKQRILYLIILLTAYALLLRTLGFLVDTFLLMTLLVKSNESSRWPGAVFAGALISGISNLVFKVWLFVPFPEGILGF
jgi:putative tricarboxylic transport membrane protein